MTTNDMMVVAGDDTFGTDQAVDMMTWDDEVGYVIMNDEIGLMTVDNGEAAYVMKHRIDGDVVYVNGGSTVEVRIRKCEHGAWCVAPAYVEQVYVRHRAMTM